MTEKGDVTVDTVSLPPTYAPSEAYTESPPPAYQRAKSTTVQVARMICFTLLAAAFMIGFFILTSNYLKAANKCDCSQQHGNFHSASIFPQVEKLVGEGNLNKIDDMNELNGNGLTFIEEEALPPKELIQNDLENEQAVPDAQEELDDVPPVQELESVINDIIETEKIEEEIEEVEEEIEREQLGIQDILRKAEMDKIKNKIKLPIDLILGNPALAGKDVNCEVERRQQPIGGGVVSQAIIVTCSDDDDESKIMRPPGLRPVSTPLSFLAPIMKMLTAKARANNPIKIKTMMSAPKPFPLPSLPRALLNQPKSLGPFPIRINGPMPGPINGPFPGPINGPLPIQSHGPIPAQFNGPIHAKLNGPMPFNVPMNGPISSRINGPISSPFNNHLPMPVNGPFPSPNNGPFPSPNNGPFPSPNNGPFSGPFDGPFSGPINGPFSGPINGPIPMPNHIRMPMNEPKPNLPPTIIRGPEPSPFNNLEQPIPKFLSKEPIMMEPKEDMPRNRMLPFALRPLIRVSPRMPRILALATKPNGLGPQTPISSLRRGANNMRSQESPKIITLKPQVPEPQARALPAPVNLPGGIRLMPARLLNAHSFLKSIRRDESSKPITHMEMRKKPEPKMANFEPPTPIFRPMNQPDFEPRFPDFGPPRVHTVIDPKNPNVVSRIIPDIEPKDEAGQSIPNIISKTLEIINSHSLPREIMSPPKPIAVITNKPGPIVGPQGPIFLPPPPAPPKSLPLPPKHIFDSEPSDNPMPPPPRHIILNSEPSDIPPSPEHIFINPKPSDNPILPPPEHLLINSDENPIPPPPEHIIINSPPQANNPLPPPLPPKMDPEGRTGIVTGINPDAEMISHHDFPSNPPGMITKEEIHAEVHEEVHEEPKNDKLHHLLVLN